MNAALHLPCPDCGGKGQHTHIGKRDVLTYSCRRCKGEGMIQDPPAGVPLHEARATVLRLVDTLRPYCERIEVAGSIRRGKAEVKDAEIVAIGTPELLLALDRLVAEGKASKALYGEAQTTRWGEAYRGLVYDGVRCEVFMTQPEAWGYQYWLRTGPAEANMFVMKWLSTRGRGAPVRFQEGYGWGSNNWRHDGKGWKAADRQRLAIPDEETLFAVLGMPYIEPHERSEARYRWLLDSRTHHWPDFQRFVVKSPAQLLLWDDRVATLFDTDLRDEPSDKARRDMAEREYRQRVLAEFYARRKEVSE